MNLRAGALIVGMLMVVFSMVIATQFGVTTVRFTYTVAHPSNADIRFIASDNSSDSLRVLRGDASNKSVGVFLGNWSANQNKTLTAAVGLVNEERFAVNITHVIVSCQGPSADYLEIWLHGDRDTQQEDETNATVCLFSKNTSSYSASTTAWTLGPGDGDANTMNQNASQSSTQSINIVVYFRSNSN